MYPQKKPPQSDYSALCFDTSDAERAYVLVHQDTDELGDDIVASPGYVDRDNQIRAASGDKWRWVEWSEAA